MSSTSINVSLNEQLLVLGESKLIIGAYNSHTKTLFVKEGLNKEYVLEHFPNLDTVFTVEKTVIVGHFALMAFDLDSYKEKSLTDF